MFLYKTQSSAKRRTDDLIFSGRSLIKIRNRTGPRTDPWGTPDRTGTGSEAWPSILNDFSNAYSEYITIKKML